MAITNGYATLPQVKAALSIETDDTGDDTRLELVIGAVSRQIDAWCGQRFWQDSAVVDRQFFAHAAHRCFVDTNHSAGVSTLTGLVVKIDEEADGTYGTTLTINTDFLVLPLNAEDEVPARPYTELRLVDNYSFPRSSNGRPGVQVTAKFGWAAVPEQVREACVTQSIRIFKRKDSPFGVAGAADFGVMRILSKLDPDVELMLAPYRKHPVGVA